MASGGGQTGDPTAYSAHLAVYDLPELRDAVYHMASLLDLDGQAALASRARRIFITLVDELTTIANDIAAAAHEAILDAEVSSRVRPDSGDTGEPKLEDHLGFSNPLGVPGSVGVNYEPELQDNVPWWWTNEEGYSGHVGREVHGFFYDAGFTGASSPSASQFREHPIFETGAAVDESGNLYSGAKMVIENPIPERRFVERGYDKVRKQWRVRVEAARGKFDRESALILNAMLRPGKP